MTTATEPTAMMVEAMREELGTPKYLFIPSASRDVGDVNEPLVQVG